MMIGSAFIDNLQTGGRIDRHGKPKCAFCKFSFANVREENGYGYDKCYRPILYMYKITIFCARRENLIRKNNSHLLKKG
jgi:transposase-like protein